MSFVLFYNGNEGENMKIVKILLSRIKSQIVYLKYKNRVNKGLFDVNILSIDKTIEFMSVRGNSIVRYGDGEFQLMNGKGITSYQEFDEMLGKRLRQIANTVEEGILVCIPEPMCGVSNYVFSSRVHWTNQLLQNSSMYRKVIKKDRVYGNSFVSRPYMIYKDKQKKKQLSFNICAFLFL